MISYALAIVRQGEIDGKTKEEIQADINRAFNPPYDFDE